MKPNLQSEDHCIKDNHPPRNFQFHPYSGENKYDEEEKEIYDDGTIAQDNQRTFQPGQRNQLSVRAPMFLVHLYIPDHYRRQEAEIQQNREFGKEAHVC